ncbi:MAG: S-layer homology domain-containing protein [Paenibacillus sp.]|uniref:S-layer homology domain-containing protein n=1 Tax=Paenibacillus sp. TaxID=58172 RepID=UPI0028FFAD26|nr:S-layer homology domain-containing protein [Paenibacillus sp.]MDU2239558.1 S-layer homology domain-containing protein [Paenibacillus sp.]
MNKKLYAKVMTSAALLSVIALPAQAATDLTDINGSYAKDAIQELVNAGILNGKGDGKFDPTGKIERQDFAIILAKALNLEMDQAPASATFRDVPADHYAYKFVEAAAASGLINGYGNGLFGTGQDLSRQDMAVIFVRALGIDATGKGAGLTFSDASNISDYAKDAVAAAVELKLLSGGTDGNFNPTGTAERQAVAAVASNFLKKYEETKKPTEGSNTPSPGETPPAPAEPDKPAAQPPVSTPSNPSPSSGGSNSGGSSQPDLTVPAIALVSASPVTIGQSLSVQSSEAGNVYLVRAADSPLTKSALDALVTEGVARKAIAIANTAVEIATSGLPEGNYKAYAVDAAGNVSTPTTAVVLQKSLQDLVVDAQTLANTAVEGEAPGNYPGVAILELRHAIMAAQSILNNSASTPTDFNNAAAALREAISVFKSTQVQPSELELQLTEGAKLVLNSELASGAEITLTDSGSGAYQYAQRSIHDFLKVTRNHVVQRLEYHPDTYIFSVFDPETDVEVATLRLESASPLIEIEPSSTGVVIRPLEALEENDEVALTFKLLDLDVFIASKDLMIKADQTPPTVSDATYNAEGSITLTFSEELPSGAFPSSPLLIYSPSGFLTDEDMVGIDPVGYTVSKMSSSQLRIQFKPETMTRYDFKSPGKFRITALNGTDYANLPLNLNVGKVEINIP